MSAGLVQLQITCQFRFDSASIKKVDVQTAKVEGCLRFIRLAAGRAHNPAVSICSLESAVSLSRSAVFYHGFILRILRFSS